MKLSITGTVWLLLLGVFLYLPAWGVLAGPQTADTIATLEAKCKNGQMASCVELGERYETGSGVAPDEGRAVQLYQRACNGSAAARHLARGDAHGCSNLGFMYRQGRGVVKDEARALQLFQRAAQLYQRACDGGHAESCISVGYMYSGGRTVTKDEARAVQVIQRAIQLYQGACDGGDASGCFHLGKAYYDLDYANGVVKPDKARAARLFQQACDGGNTRGCVFLAGGDWEMIDMDEARRMQLYQRACDGGDDNGCFNLGEIYQGHDVARATQLYQRACDAGEDNACQSLGTICRYGRLPTLGDQERPMPMLQSACDEANSTGYWGCCSQVAWMYAEGRGVAMDLRRAATYYEKACRTGHNPLACQALAKLKK